MRLAQLQRGGDPMRCEAPGISRADTPEIGDWGACQCCVDRSRSGERHHPVRRPFREAICEFGERFRRGHADRNRNPRPLLDGGPEPLPIPAQVLRGEASQGVQALLDDNAICFIGHMPLSGNNAWTPNLSDFNGVSSAVYFNHTG